MHCIRLQSEGSSAAEKSRDALRPPQTHHRPRPTPITRTMRCSRRIHPRSHRPKPPKTGQTQADDARRRITSRASGRLPLQINPIAKAQAPNAAAFQRNRLIAVARCAAHQALLYPESDALRSIGPHPSRGGSCCAPASSRRATRRTTARSRWQTPKGRRPSRCPARRSARIPAGFPSGSRSA